MSHAAIVMPIAFGAFLATMVGGLFALSLRDRLHLVLGFSAGAVIGLAFFDLLPEAVETGGTWGPRTILALSALGFFLYTLVDRLVLLHNHDGDSTKVKPRLDRRGQLFRPQRAGRLRHRRRFSGQPGGGRGHRHRRAGA